MIIPQTSSDGKFHKGKGGTVAGVWLSWRFCATAPSLGVRRLRDSRASLSCDLPPPACLLPGQQERTVGQVPDGLFCHTLRNAIDCGSEKAIYCNLWGKDWGIMTARKKREVCWCCKWNQAQGLQAALEAKWRHREAWDAPRVTGTIKSKGIRAVARVVFASAEQARSSSSSNTSLYCLWRNALFPTLRPCGSQEVHASPTCRGWDHTPGLTNQCALLCQPHWLADGCKCVKREWHSTTSIP